MHSVGIIRAPLRKKNEIARKELALKISSDEFEFKQKEKCLEIKENYQEKQPKLEYNDTVEHTVIYNKEDNTCYFYTHDISTLDPKEMHNFYSIIDLLKDESILWYPSTEIQTFEEFLEKKRELGF